MPNGCGIFACLSACKEILATIPTDKKVGQMNNGVETIVKARANS